MASPIIGKELEEPGHAPKLATTILCSLVEAPRDVLPDMHPQRPWVLSAVEQGDQGTTAVAVYDYKRRETLRTLSLAAIEQQAFLHASPDQRARIEGQRPAGPLQAIKFCDSQVRSWKALVERMWTGSPAPGRAKESLEACGNLAVLAYEYRVLLLDYMTGHASEVYFSELRGAAISSLEVLSRGRAVALGGADGAVRLWDVDRRETIRALAGAHKNASVTRVLGFNAAPDASLAGYSLVSAASDGSVAFWSAVMTPGARLERAFAKAHDGPVHDMAYWALDGLVATSGADRTVVLWDPRAQTELRRVSTGKRPLLSAQAFAHPQFAVHTIIGVKRDSSELHVVDFHAGKTRAVVNVTEVKTLSRRSEARSHKVHSLSVHPLHPHLVLVNCTKGVFLFRFSVERTPDYCISRSAVSATRTELCMLYEVDGVAYSRFIGNRASEPERLAELAAPAALLSSTLSGSHVIAQYPDLQRYQVFDTTSAVAGWSLVEEGFYYGHIAVSTMNDRFALIEVTYPHVVEQKKRWGLVRSKEEKTCAPQIRFVIKSVGEGGGAKVVYETITTTRPIERLHGGMLLGVTYAPDSTVPPLAPMAPAPSSAAASSSSAAAQGGGPPEQLTFQFYRWDSISDAHKVGGLLPRPDSVVWDHARRVFVLRCRATFSIYALKDGLDEREPYYLICKCYAATSSIVCLESCLVATTDDSVKCFFYQKDAAESLTIATIGSDNFESEELSVMCGSGRPVGALSAVIADSDHVVTVDCAKRVHEYSLAHPVVRFYSAVAAGNLGAARAFAERAGTAFHAQMALFLAKRGHHTEALHLRGIPDSVKLLLCIRHRVFEGALPVLRSLVDATLARFRAHRPSVVAGPAEAAAQAALQPAGQPQPLALSLSPCCAQGSGLTIPKIVDHAVALAAAAAGTPSAAALAPEILRAVLPLDPGRVYRHLAVMLVSSGRTAELKALAAEVSAKLSAGTPGMHAAAALASALAGDAQGVKAALLHAPTVGEAALRCWSDAGFVSGWSESVASNWPCVPPGTFTQA
eukprot:m51a1_g7051 TSET complex, TTRAY2 subunit (1036) ;mRNA; f:145567-149747